MNFIFVSIVDLFVIFYFLICSSYIYANDIIVKCTYKDEVYYCDFKQEITRQSFINKDLYLHKDTEKVYLRNEFDPIYQNDPNNYSPVFITDVLEKPLSFLKKIDNETLTFIIVKFANDPKRQIKCEGETLYSIDDQIIDGTKIDELEFALKIKLENSHIPEIKLKNIKDAIHKSFNIKAALFNSSLRYCSFYRFNSDYPVQIFINNKYRKRFINQFYYLYRFTLIKDDLFDGAYKLKYSDLKKDKKKDIQISFDILNKINDITDFIKTQNWLNCTTTPIKNKTFKCEIDKTITGNDLQQKINDSLKYPNYLCAKVISNDSINITNRNIVFQKMESNSCNNKSLEGTIFILNQERFITEKDQNPKTIQSFEPDFLTSLNSVKNKEILNDQLSIYGLGYDKIEVKNDKTVNVLLKNIEYIKIFINLKDDKDNTKFKEDTFVYKSKYLSQYKENSNKHVIMKICENEIIKAEDIKSKEDYFDITFQEGLFYATPKQNKITIETPDSSFINSITDLLLKDSNWLSEYKKSTDDNNQKVFNCNISIKYNEVEDKIKTDNKYPNYFKINYENKKITFKPRGLLIPDKEYCGVQNKTITLFSENFKLGKNKSINFEIFKKLQNATELNKLLTKYSLEFDNFEINDDVLKLNLKQKTKKIILKFYNEGDKTKFQEFLSHEFKYKELLFNNTSDNKKKKVEIPKCEEIDIKLLQKNIAKYTIEKNKDPKIINEYIATPLTNQKFKVIYYKRRFNKELEEMYPDPKIKIVLNKIIDITPTKYSFSKDIELPDIPKNINKKFEYDFFTKVTPVNYIQYFGREKNQLKYLLKDIDKKVLIIYYPISYTTGFRSFFYKNEDKIIYLSSKLRNFLNKVKELKFYDEIFVRISNTKIFKFDGNLDSSCFWDKRSFTSNEYSWSSEESFNSDFKVPISYYSHILFFSRYTENRDIISQFKKMKFVKVYLINFVAYDINLSKYNYIKIQNITNSEDVINDDLKNVIQYEKIKKFFNFKK